MRSIWKWVLLQLGRTTYRVFHKICSQNCLAHVHWEDLTHNNPCGGVHEIDPGQTLGAKLPVECGSPFRQADLAACIFRCVCLLIGRKFNPSRCSGCAYEFRAILGRLQSCSIEVSRVLRRSLAVKPLTNTDRTGTDAKHWLEEGRWSSTPTRFRRNFIFFQRLGGFAGQQKAAIRDFGPSSCANSASGTDGNRVLNLDVQSPQARPWGQFDSCVRLCLLIIFVAVFISLGTSKCKTAWNGCCACGPKICSMVSLPW